MVKPTVQRRLAAIVCADMVGFSRLMEADEVGTLSRLQSVRAELIDPKISEHRGRLVKTTGDGMLVEFASVTDAVQSCVEIQRAMSDRNRNIPDDRRIQFRIGVPLIAPPGTEPGLWLWLGNKCDIRGRLCTLFSTENIPVVGPGEITGIDSQAIIKNQPNNWITNFEPNYLPYIEFYPEDFPRKSPV